MFCLIELNLFLLYQSIFYRLYNCQISNICISNVSEIFLPKFLATFNFFTIF